MPGDNTTSPLFENIGSPFPILEENSEKRNETTSPTVVETNKALNGVFDFLGNNEARSSPVLIQESTTKEGIAEGIIAQTTNTLTPTIQVVSLSEIVQVRENIDAVGKNIEETRDENTSSKNINTASQKNKDEQIFGEYLKKDQIYQSMLKITDGEKIRVRLAIRYALLVFAFFLVFAWIVNNRVIMFGLTEFVWLARIRDGLFAIMSGLFCMTIWLGSTVWVRQKWLVTFTKTLSVLFFIAILFALYIS